MNGLRSVTVEAQKESCSTQGGTTKDELEFFPGMKWREQGGFVQSREKAIRGPIQGFVCDPQAEWRCHINGYGQHKNKRVIWIRSLM